MKDYQRDFLQLCIDQQVLRFGEFTLKSGRKSPYFFNAGLFNSGSVLRQLGAHYAAAIEDSGLEFDLLFGPAYKGIPLAAAIAMAYSEHYGRDVPFAYDRKEAKDHGEGGQLVGAPVEGRVLVVDDVISAGTSIRFSADLIAAAGAQFVGVAIALDRQERGRNDRAASSEVAEQYGVEMVSIIDLSTLIDFLGRDDALRQAHEQVSQYRAAYGPKS
jgi:orotate phosphoribosyltransferase